MGKSPCRRDDGGSDGDLKNENEAVSRVGGGAPFIERLHTLGLYMRLLLAYIKLCGVSMI